MSLDPLTAILDIGGKVLDKVFPDPAQAANAKLELYKLQQTGQLEEMKTTLSAIIAEANSTDPWTSRARPSFLYVVYVLILFSLPMGLVSAWSPDTATAIASGMKAWLGAIPDTIIELFKWVMLGYIGGRSFEKVKGAA